MSGESFDLGDLTPVEHTAVDWVTRVECGLTLDERAELDEWLNASPEHREAYDEIRWDWEELDRLAGYHVNYDSSEDPDLIVRKRFSPIEFVPSEYWKFIASAAAVLVVALSVSLTLKEDNRETFAESDDQVVVERIGTRDLKDGSAVKLNRGAEIEVAFSKSERLVRLSQGEAHFMVAKDASRPFVVLVSGVRLRAVGTEFNVRFAEDQVDVIVTEGTVSIATEGQESSKSEDSADALLEENHRAIVDLQSADRIPQIERIETSVMKEELLWQPELIDFENVSLGIIVEEFNRRNPFKMVIVDASINEARMSSVFWSDNLNGFIRLLESNFSVRAEWGEDGTIYLFTN